MIRSLSFYILTISIVKSFIQPKFSSSFYRKAFIKMDEITTTISSNTANTINTKQDTVKPDDEINYLELYLIKLQHKDHLHSVKIVNRDDVPENSQIVKSLVWTYLKTNPILLILSLDSSVDKVKLANYLEMKSIKHVRMASPELVYSVTGQRVGNVSPIGHKLTVRTIVDAKLLVKHNYFVDSSTVATTTNADATSIDTATTNNNHTSTIIPTSSNDIVCYGGGGSDGKELAIKLSDLLALSKAEVVDISVDICDTNDTI